MAVQATAFFCNPHPLLSASFTLSHGISPSTCTLSTPPITGFVPLSGPLVLQYGNQRLVFSNCRMDKIETRFDDAGHQTWEMTILDRRWLWRETGCISGFYNVRRGTTNTSIDKQTEKTPRELATLCLEAMGERNYDLSYMPNDARPEIDWDYENPADALARVCDAVGARVILGIDDRVWIVRAGIGRPLPIGPVLDGGFQTDPPDVPGLLCIVSARAKYQIDATLEPMAKEINGAYVPLDEVSYTPIVYGERTWAYSDCEHFQNLTDPRYRGLAQQSVFRAYRIKVPIDIPAYGKVETLARILPLLNEQVEYAMVNERPEPRPPWVYGNYWGGFETVDPLSPNIQPKLPNQPSSLYTRGFSIDSEKGLVVFSEPAIVLGRNARNDLAVGPADLRLRIAVNVRDKDTRGWLRMEVEQKLQKRRGQRVAPNMKRRYILRDDIIPWVYTDYEHGGRVLHNHDDVRTQSDYYLQTEASKYQLTDGGSVTYAGWMFHPVDGAIQQVSWSVDANGRATTRMSRNREELVITPSFQERRMLEQLQSSLERREKPERQRSEDMRMRKG